MDTIALISTARDDFAQENDCSCFFCDSYIQTANARQHLCHFYQFVVVCGKEGTGTATFVVVQIFDDGTGDGQTIIGASAASDLVENEQAAGCGVMEDVCCLYHLHHEGTLACCQVVLGTDAREDAVHQANSGCFGGNVATDLGHKDNQCDLA